MGTIPTIINGAVSVADAILHALIYDVAVNAAIAAATAYMPWLGWPIISTLFRFFVTKFTDVFYVQLEKTMSFSIINFQTQAEQTAYDKAVNDFKAAHATGDADAIAKAKADFKTKLASLVHSDGS